MPKLRIDAGFFLWSAALLLLLPINLAAAATMASAFHELFHYWTTRLLGGNILSITVGASGARMLTSPLPPAKQLIAVLAGPAGGILLAALIRWFPLLGLCGLIQSIYNLLPIRSLDGGQALQCTMELAFTKATADAVCKTAEILCICLLTAAGVYAAVVYSLGAVALSVPLLLSLRILSGKIPCKTGAQRVQ